MKDTTPETSVSLRDATPNDARALAELIGIAGAGIPQWLWSGMAEPGEEVFEVGERRARRTTGGFSWINAIVADHGGAVIGMILGYPIDPDASDLAELPPILRPFAELERLVPGSWYINAFALFEPWRSRGVGSRLLEAAEARARAAKCKQISVQTFSATPRAEAFYLRHGFRRVDTRPLPDASPCQYRGDTVLLLRDVGAVTSGSEPISANR
jgi:GNAT superfamily N-acetyltransferase